MLSNSVALEPNAIEMHFCIPFKKLIPEEDKLSIDDKKMFIQVSSMPETLDEDEKQNEQLRRIPLYVAIEKCLSEQFTVGLCFRTKFWIAYITSDTATMFMYLVYIQYAAKKLDKQFINFRTFCEQLFPYGFPEKQKVFDLVNTLQVESSERPNGINLLTFKTAMESIQFKTNLYPDKTVIDNSNLIKEYDDSNLINEVRENKFKKQQDASAPKFSALDMIKNPHFLSNLKKI